MKKVTRFLIVSFLMVMAVFFASDVFAGLTLEGRYWSTDLNSRIRIASGTSAGTELNPVDDLGFKEKNKFWEVRVAIGSDGNRLRYAYVPFKWDATTNLSRSIDFNGKTYTASTQVTSELDIKYHRLGWESSKVDKSGSKFGAIFDIKYLDISATIDAPGLGLHEKKSLQAVIPTLGFVLQVALPLQMSVGGEVTGVRAASDKYLVDAEMQASMKLLPFLHVSAGYRILKVHLEQDNNLGAFTLKGPFALLKAEF